MKKPPLYFVNHEYKKVIFLNSSGTEDIEIDQIDDKLASIDARMPSDSVSADILCDQSLGVTVLSVGGLDRDLTYDKYIELYDAEW